MATAAAKAYLLELAQTAGLSAEDLATLTKVAENEKFATELNNGTKRQSDYSRAMDETRKLKTDTEAQIKTWKEWYENAVQVDAAREEELKQLRANPNNPNPNPPTPTGLTKKEIEEREGRMIQVIKQMGRISSRHAAKFGEELDTDAIEKIALDQGLTVDRAYEQYIAPRVKEAEAKNVEERIKAAREEGVREGMSKREVPGEGSRAFHPVFDHNRPAAGTTVPTKLSDAQRSANFAEAWTTANKQ